MKQSETAASDSSAKRPPAGEEDVFNTGAVLTISTAHLVHDTYPSFLGPLLPLLIPKIGMSMTAAGALTAALRGPSLLQPFFGAWADGTDVRYFVILTPTITALGMSLLGLAPNYLALVVLLVVAGLSITAFHPAAAASATWASGSRWGVGSSFFMTGGELGRVVSPLLIVSVVNAFGLESSYLAAIPGILFSLVLYLQLRRAGPARMTGTTPGAIWKAIKDQKGPLLLFTGFAFFRAVAIAAFSTFYPTYLTQEQGLSLIFAGMAVAVYELGGATGAMLGGILSDRFGRKPTLLVSQLLTGPVLFMALAMPEGLLGLVLLALGGALAISAAPVQLTLAQELLPGGRSTAAGIVFFINFEGTLITIVIGAVADMIGLGPALAGSVLASMLSIPFTMALPETRRSG